MVYSTCSLEPEECERVGEAVLAEVGAKWKQTDAGDLLRALRERGVLQGEFDAVRGGALRTLPGVHPVDGFYARVLTRS